VHGTNSPLPKTFRSDPSLSPVVWMVPWQREGEEDAAGSDKRENISEQIDRGEDGGGWGWVCETDGGWGEIEKTRKEDEDDREGSAEKSIMPLHFIGNY